METIDEETLAAAKDFITRQKNAGKPFFCWWNETRMHFRTHVKAEQPWHFGPGRVLETAWSSMMRMVGDFLKLVDDLGIADDTIVHVLDR